MSFLLLIILISIALPIYVIGYPIHLSGKIKKLQLRVELLERQAGSRLVDTAAATKPAPIEEDENPVTENGQDWKDWSPGDL